MYAYLLHGRRRYLLIGQSSCLCRTATHTRRQPVQKSYCMTCEKYTAMDARLYARLCDVVLRASALKGERRQPWRHRYRATSNCTEHAARSVDNATFPTMLSFDLMHAVTKKQSCQSRSQLAQYQSIKHMRIVKLRFAYKHQFAFHIVHWDIARRTNTTR